jgi:hypothetical protein
MERTTEVKAGIIDGLDHINIKIQFMSDACVSISKQEYAIDEETAAGMLMFFEEISNQVAAIKKEITDMFLEEIKTAKV